MEHNQKEILERVLLLMKYDNSQTLSENLEKVQILEQSTEQQKKQQDLDYLNLSNDDFYNKYGIDKEDITDPPTTRVPVSDYITNLKSGSKAQTYLYSSPEMIQSVNKGYEGDIKNYACQLKSLTMRELVELFKKITPTSGVITPDFIGYGMYNNPTISSVILENEIYSRRDLNKNDFSKIMIPIKEILRKEFFEKKYQNIVKYTNNNIGQTPQIPKKSLLSGLPAAIVIERPATTICNENSVTAYVEPTPTKYQIQQKLKQTQKTVSTFKTRKEAWDSISNKLVTKEGYLTRDSRGNDSKKNDTLKFYNEVNMGGDRGMYLGEPSKIDKSWEDFFSLTPEEFYRYLSKSPQDKRGPLTSLYENKKFDEDIIQSLFNGGQNIYMYAVEAGYTEQEAAEFLKKFGTPNEKSEIELMTAVSGKENERQEEEIVKELVSSQSDITKNPILLRVFPKNVIDESLQDENCKKQYLKFFQGIIDGSVLNSNNRIVGQPYYNSEKKLFYAKWDEPKPPCNDEWWEKHGWKLQIGAAVVAGILLPGYGWGLALQVFIDAGLNVYSLQKAKQAQDKDRINLETLYLLLPLIMASRPVRVALEEMKFSKPVIDSLISKISRIRPSMTTIEREIVLSKLTKEESRALTMMGTSSKVREVLKQTSKDTLEKLKSTAKSAKVNPLRKVSEPIVNLLVYGVPMVGYVGYQIANLDKIVNKKLGRPLNKEEKEIWALIISHLSEEDAGEFVSWMDTLSLDEVRKKVTTGAEIYKELKNKTNVKGLTDEEGEKVAEGLRSIVDKFFDNLGAPDDIELLDAPLDSIDIPNDDKN